MAKLHNKNKSLLNNINNIKINAKDAINKMISLINDISMENSLSLDKSPKKILISKSTLIQMKSTIDKIKKIAASDLKANVSRLLIQNE